MSDIEEQKKLENPFVVSLIEPIATPDGCEGKNWFRYVISRNGTNIDGLSSGSKTQVTRHAQTVADDLNARSSGRPSSTWTPRQKR